MYIYKITNKINNKVYIGQVYNKSIYARFDRHIHEASKNSKGYLARAIVKYGAENFICEQIDTATSLQELNEKEKYWIQYYNSTDKNIGYNLTLGGDGGNTYLCKTEDEMRKIKQKISVSNSGKNNGQSKQIKALNVDTNEIIHFDTLNDACNYFSYKQKGTFVYYCENKPKYLWRKKWTFAYENNEFDLDGVEIEYDKSCRKGTKVKLIDLNDNSEQIFNSLNKLNIFLGLPKGKIKFVDGVGLYKNYQIIKIMSNDKCVSTIPDECKGVGLDISTSSKQEAL